MPSKPLLILVEGDDDKNFFEQVVVPEIRKNYQLVRIDDYKQRSPTRIKKERIMPCSRAGFQCIIVADADEELDVERKQSSLAEDYGVEKKDVIVVVRVIEGWYLAGLSKARCKQLRVPDGRTDKLTKNGFNRISNRTGMTSRELKIQLLKYFSIPVAKQKNVSFDHFATKYRCGVC